MFTFATDYFILVFIGTVGVIQVGASLGRLSGLLFLKSLLAARILGLTLVLAAFILFFSTGTRNINDYEGGLDGPTQALFFFLGSSAGVAITFLVSSLVNARMKTSEISPEGGLDALKETNYARALGRSLGYWWRQWPTQMKRYFSG